MAASPAGIAGTVVGAGAGSAHLAKAGLDVAAVLAVIVLVTGLVLLIWGAAALVRAIPGWWRLLAIPVALAVAQFVLMPLTFAFYATNVPPGPLGTGTPAQYGLTYQDVAFRTADGVRLSAWYIPARNGAAVVLLPARGPPAPRCSARPRCWPGTGRRAAGRWPRPDRSGGHAMEFGWWGGGYLAAAVSFLAAQPPHPGREDRRARRVDGR